MKIVAISPPFNFTKEIEVITGLFENGLQTYHIRKPLYRKARLRDFLEKVPTEFRNRIIIHSHHSLIRSFNLQGVHYTEKDLEPTFRNWYRERSLASRIKKLVRTTSHKKLASLYEKSDMPFEYVFLMPVFDPITGNYQSGYYEQGIKAAIQKTGKKIIVMGGVNIEKIEKINELGFYGMGLSACLWDKEDPVKEYIKITRRCSELGIPLT
jgi:thiamine-phosphate pyrophosphorylase